MAVKPHLKLKQVQWSCLDLPLGLTCSVYGTVLKYLGLFSFFHLTLHCRGFYIEGSFICNKLMCKKAKTYKKVLSSHSFWYLKIQTSPIQYFLVWNAWLHTHQHKPDGLPYLVWNGIQDRITLISYWCFLAIFPSSLFLISCWEERHTSIHWQWPAHPPKGKPLLPLPHFITWQSKDCPIQMHWRAFRIIQLSKLLSLLTSVVLLFLVWR